MSIALKSHKNSKGQKKVKKGHERTTKSGDHTAKIALELDRHNQKTSSCLAIIFDDPTVVLSIFKIKKIIFESLGIIFLRNPIFSTGLNT